MIVSVATPAHERPKHPGGCGCGCEEPRDVCCELDCITAPRYFCGQLLTDQDLQALVEWTREKTRLSRHRHGWGVVCGLDVRCGPGAGSVSVGPGYAVSCCGDDIIVCEETTHDLSSACLPPIEPCEEVPGKTERAGPIALAAASSRVAVDLYLHYEEQPADARSALARGTCTTVSACEHARVKEGFRIEHRTANGDPFTAAAARWLDGYEDTLQVLDEFRAAFPDALEPDEDADAVRRWLRTAVDRRPQRHLCFVADQLCALDDAALLAQLPELLLWLVQDRRNAYLACGCSGCAPDPGVLIARVWLEQQRGGAVGCRVAAIDPYWPHRRVIAPDCWPAPPGSRNLGELIWHRREEVCVRLADLGVAVTFEKWQPPADLAQLRRDLACSPIVPCGARRRALVVQAGNYEWRVVGFCAPAGGDRVDRIEGIGERRARLLADAGIATLEEFVVADPDRLVTIMGVQPNLVERFRERAGEMLNR